MPIEPSTEAVLLRQTYKSRDLLQLQWAVRWQQQQRRRLGQLSLLPSAYQPKCGDALRLGSKGRYGSFQLWINVWVAGKTV